MFRQLQTILTIVQLYSKGGLVEKTIMYNSVHTAKFEISLPVTLCLPLKNCRSQFLSHWESGEPVFYSVKVWSFVHFDVCWELQGVKVNSGNIWVQNLGGTKRYLRRKPYYSALKWHSESGCGIIMGLPRPPALK